ncbi:hypothetical protein HUJ04_000835 [Dendroctonus ponderosae]|nr:hypothetical protein HUJ04_000835 [Dendroctonus ponderosae]
MPIFLKVKFTLEREIGMVWLCGSTLLNCVKVPHQKSSKKIQKEIEVFYHTGHYQLLKEEYRKKKKELSKRANPYYIGYILRGSRYELVRLSKEKDPIVITSWITSLRKKTYDEEGSIEERLLRRVSLGNLALVGGALRWPSPNSVGLNSQTSQDNHCKAPQFFCYSRSADYGIGSKVSHLVWFMAKESDPRRNAQFNDRRAVEMRWCKAAPKAAWKQRYLALVVSIEVLR